MLFFFRLALRNALRHKLRSGLTLLGLAIAIMSFGLLRTVVEAWYAGAEASAANRLVTRNAISLIFSLPISHKNKIRQIEGIEGISYANWFAGVYISEKNFFPQFAIDPRSYFELYPEYLIPPEQLAGFLRDRKGAIAGRKLAEQYGWKIGDVIPIRGTIYPGTWSFVLRGIYRGNTPKVDETQFFFHWDNLNETVKKTTPSQAEHVGIYLTTLTDPRRAAEVSEAIDALFKNSLAETLTETEKAFQLGFVAMTEAILIAIEIVSFVVIVIIMVVMANTMAMSARERTREYATLKALGFGPGHLVFLVLCESVLLALMGGLAGVLLCYPVADAFGAKMGTLFPVFNISDATVWMAIAAALLVGLVAALTPSWRAVKIPITAGLGALD